MELKEHVWTMERFYDTLHLTPAYMTHSYYGEGHYLFSFANSILVLVKMTAE